MSDKSTTPVTFSFDVDELSEQYKASVREIGKLVLEYQETITKYNEYRGKVDEIKEQFFEESREAGIPVNDTLETDAQSAVASGKIVPEAIETHRLSGKVKTSYLADVISSIIKDKKQDSDGWYEFLNLKKDFIAYAASQDKNVQIQSQGYFAVPMYKNGPQLLEDDSDGKRIYMKKEAYPTKNGEESKLPRVYVNLKKLQDWIKKHPAPAK